MKIYFDIIRLILDLIIFFPVDCLLSVWDGSGAFQKSRHQDRPTTGASFGKFFFFLHPSILIPPWKELISGLIQRASKIATPKKATANSSRKVYSN